LVTIFLIADLSALSVSGYNSDEVSNLDQRLPDRAGKYASEDYGWWFSYGPDINFDGMDDRLEAVISGEKSVSTTSVMGSDGRWTVAIVVDFAWHPGGPEVEELTAILRKHGWSSEDSWFQIMDSIDSIVVDHVPVSSLTEILALQSVVVVEMQNVMASTLQTANPATRIQPSDVYAGSVYDRGYDGTGVVIAVLDSGVDNEHRALNDFDDENDEPDLDPNSYDDQKWVAGFDATSQASNPDGSQDPDDGQGHGTHVAGIALGTGDSSRVHIGGAPGAYLVDVKVLTDTGGTNSQNSLNGIQWMINNKDTNWGDGAKGIDIGQMSFGSIGNALDPEDTGDNGTGAEARLVNNATENGIACIIAAGNDGKRRIASPGSADGAITIASADNADTINRTDDFIASYSNSGPREDDNDNDDWDELKPDLTAFGSGIMSASAATGSSLPGSPRPMADNSYESKDGTSMATPLVSGVVALMLQADSSLDPYEIKNILRNSSEEMGTPSEPSVSNRWNEDWGFGSLDASCAIDTVLERSCTPFAESNGTVIITPPNQSENEPGITLSSPENGTWLIAGDIVRIQGGIINSTGPWDKVDIRIIQHLDDGEEKTLLDWTTAGGDINSWYLDVLIKGEWYSANEEYIVVEATASDDEDLQSTQSRWARIGRMIVNFASPSSGSSLTGTASFSGSAQGIEPSQLLYKINNGDWNIAHNFDEEDNEMQDWTFTWDSTLVDDGSHRVSVKLVNVSGMESSTVRRTFTIDNQPAAPALSFQGSVEIIDQGLPANTAVAGTILEIHFNVVNTGDADATDLHVKLVAPGSESSTYPSEGQIPRLDQGETTSVILWWWATNAGEDLNVEIQIDPYGSQNEIDTTDNSYQFDFTIQERPVEPMLRFMSSSVLTSPLIPNPSSDENPSSYTVNIRIDNLGQTDATDLTMTFFTWEEVGWVEKGTKQISVIPGSTTSSGNKKVTFSNTASSIGLVKHRAILSGDGVEAQYSELRFGVIIDEFGLGGVTRLTLSDGEAVLGFVGLEQGGLLFTTIDGELHARTITESFGMPGDTLIESDWGGEFAFTTRSDGRAHIAWNKRFTDQLGYTMTDLSMASIGAQGDLSGEDSFLTPLKQSEGYYWGLDLSERDGEVVLAGYHRDISTSGSWMDVTNIFMVHNENAISGSSWTQRMNVLNDIDIKPNDGDPLAVAIGNSQIHLLYQEMRDDGTGIERVGLFYSHGIIDQVPFNFQAPAGDDASIPNLLVRDEGSKDVLIAAWAMGSGRETQLMTQVQDSIWSVDEIQNVSAPGLSRIVMYQVDSSVKFYFDELGIEGPVIRYGIHLKGDSEISLSNIIGSDNLIGAGDLDGDQMVIVSSPSGQISGKQLLSISGPDIEEDKGILDMILDPLPGDTNEQKFAVLLGIGCFLLVLHITVLVVLRRTHREEEELEVSAEDGDLELLIQTEEDAGPLVLYSDVQNTELKVVLDDDQDIESNEIETSLAEELEAKVESGTASKRLERRMKRKEQREVKEVMEKVISGLPPLPLPGELPPLEGLPLPSPDELTPLGLPPLPTPPLPGELPPIGLPPLPAPERNVGCDNCGSNITVKDMTLRKMECPICAEIIQM
jgi:subtilisin family serine protease